MITYIKLSVRKHYVDFEEPLNEELFEIGSTWEDYIADKWIPLTDELLTFKEENPNASILEVFCMLLTPEPEPYVKTLQEVRSSKINEINNYDTSESVNSFYLNDSQVWLDKATRVGLMNSLNIEKNSGKELSVLWFNGLRLELNVNAAIQMLSSVELYALECYNVTATHISNVSNLETIEEVESYDYTINYPEKLSFNI